MKLVVVYNLLTLAYAKGIYSEELSFRQGELHIQLGHKQHTAIQGLG